MTAYFIANERRWAYFAGSGVAIGLYLLVQLIAFFTFNRTLFGLLGNLFFAGVLLALAPLHPDEPVVRKRSGSAEGRAAAPDRRSSGLI